MIYKAVTLYQPWASAIFTLRENPAHDGDFIKTIETRDWANYYAGEMAIHAGKEFGKLKADKEYAQKLAELWGLDPSNLPRGSVLGIVRITRCWKFKYPEVETETAPHRYKGIPTGNFGVGRFGWNLKVIEIFATPIPARGHQLLWNWDRP